MTSNVSKSSHSPVARLKICGNKLGFLEDELPFMVANISWNVHSVTLDWDDRNSKSKVTLHKASNERTLTENYSITIDRSILVLELHPSHQALGFVIKEEALYLSTVEHFHVVSLVQKILIKLLTEGLSVESVVGMNNTHIKSVHALVLLEMLETSIQ